MENNNPLTAMASVSTTKEECEKEGEITRLVSIINNQVERLFGTLQDLDIRLGAVVVPVSETKKAKQQDEPSMTPLGAELVRVSCKLDTLGEDIVDLTLRVKL